MSDTERFYRQIRAGFDVEMGGGVRVDPTTALRAVHVAERVRPWYGGYPGVFPAPNGDLLLNWDFGDPPVEVKFWVKENHESRATLVDPDGAYEVSIEAAGVEALIVNIVQCGRGWA